jgi:putative transposase
VDFSLAVKKKPISIDLAVPAIATTPIRLYALQMKPYRFRMYDPITVSRHVQKWLKEKHVNTHYIDPGNPWQNAYNESFNSNFRMTCLDRCLFSSLTEARVIISQWLEEYNTVRPHGSLGGMNPEQFLQRWAKATLNQQPKTLTG